MKFSENEWLGGLGQKSEKLQGHIKVTAASHTTVSVQPVCGWTATATPSLETGPEGGDHRWENSYPTYFHLYFLLFIFFLQLQTHCGKTVIALNLCHSHLLVLSLQTPSITSWMFAIEGATSPPVCQAELWQDPATENLLCPPTALHGLLDSYFLMLWTEPTIK